jgi:hypothetical protein
MFGIYAILQSAALFTAYKVPGFADPFELLKSIPENDFVQLGMRAPVMADGPMLNKGFFYPRPVLRPTEGGKTVTSTELQDLLLLEKLASRSDMRRPPEKRQVERSKNHTTSGRGCPVDFEPLVGPVIDWVIRRHNFVATQCAS